MKIIANNTILGNNLRYLREKAGISWEQFEELVLWDMFDMEDLESGSLFEIDSEILERICRVFSVDMNDMLTKELVCET